MFYATRLSRRLPPRLTPKNHTPNYDPWDQIRASRRAQYAWIKAWVDGPVVGYIIHQPVSNYEYTFMYCYACKPEVMKFLVRKYQIHFYTAHHRHKKSSCYISQNCTYCTKCDWT